MRALLLVAAAVVLLGGLFLGRVVYKSIRRIDDGLVPHREQVPALATVKDVPPGREVSFRTQDGLTLRAWLFPPRNGATVLVGHGHRATRMQVLDQARLLLRNGFGVLLLDWRANGESEGDRVMWGQEEKRDVFAALDFLSQQPDVDPARIGALGFSMGGLIIALASAEDPRLRATAIEGVYTSLEEQTLKDEARYGVWSQRPALWALRRGGIDLDQVRPEQVLCRISPRPLLLIYGTDDIGGPEIARRMERAACEPKRLFWVEGARHGQYLEVAAAAMEKELVAFFTEALGVGQRGPAPTEPR